MTEQRKTAGTIAFEWWSREIAARDVSSARGLSARLRRAAPLAALCEPAVIELARSLSMGPAQAGDLVRLVTLLAHIRSSGADTLAQRLGREAPRERRLDSEKQPLMSRDRFERMIRAEGVELTDHLRRAVIMADRDCNVSALATDLLHWQAARPRWCFHYFGADAPAKPIEENIL